MANSLTTILLAALASSGMTSATPRHPLNDNFTGHVHAASVRKAAKLPRLAVINDDFEKARTEANKRTLPLFVEVWASW